MLDVTVVKRSKELIFIRAVSNYIQIKIHIQLPSNEKNRKCHHSFCLKTNGKVF